MVTGEQGSSVAKYMKEDGWDVIGLTRNTESDKAKGTTKLIPSSRLTSHSSPFVT